MLNRTILFVCAAAALGCPLDPKTVGQSSATDDGSEGGSGESGSDGSASMSSTDDGSSGPSVSGGSSDDGACMHDGCPWEPCVDAVCGTFCNLCAPWDTECAEPGTYTVCAASGECEIWDDWSIDACPGEGLQPGFEATLDQIGGCSDMTVYAANGDATTALHLRVDGLVDEAHTAGETIMREYDGDDAALMIEVTFGSDLLAQTCNDAPTGAPMALEHWVPTTMEGGGAGTVTIEITPDPGGPPNATATVTFDNVPLRRNDPDIFDPDLAIEHLVITDASVGWLPG